MCKKLTYLVSFVLLLSVALTGTTKAELVGWWRFDEGSGTVANDSSGYGNDGTLDGDPLWAVGMLGSALEFDGTDDVIEVPLQPSITFEQGDSFSVLAWVKTGATPSPQDGIVGNYRVSTAPFWMLIANEAVKGTGATMYVRDVGRAHSTIIDSPDPINTGTWLHLAGVRDQQAKKLRLYVNGELVGEKDDETENINSGQSVWIGDHLNRFYDGLMDDVRIYNRPLMDTEILGVMSGGGAEYPRALGPNPADGAMLEGTWVTLGWQPGDYAISHDVYLGDNFDDVDNGTGDTFRGNQSATMLVAGFAGFPYPDGLVPGTTYYWRIDEVNDSEPNSPWKGDIWSFSIPPKTAYAPDPADGAEFVDPNATFTWTPGFGGKLHTVYMGTSFDDVNDAAGGVPLGSASYDPGTLESEKVYYWRVDEFDPPFTHKGDVWSFTTPGAVGNPQPANGEVDVQMNATLSWTAADNAASHELYFGTDQDAVNNATTASPEYVGPKALGAESHDPGGLAWDSSYAWRVDEVYPTETVKGLVWSFETADFITVDDFESYNDVDPPDSNSNRIFDIWIDGFGTTTNGALVGNDLPPYAETTIVHGGTQSMIYRFDNAGKTSEATLTLVYPRDWTEEGVTKLSLWFRGASANAADRMFVALGNAVVYHDDPAVTQITGWNEWVIDLTQFAGVDLANVNNITIGIGTRNSPAAGGTGTIYFDDIWLVR